MDKAQRKAMVEQWKLRRPEMGVISIRCKATGEAFLGASKDTKADFNSNRAKLSMGSHPNKRLAALWEQYGEEVFEWSVLNWITKIPGTITPPSWRSCGSNVWPRTRRRSRSGSNGRHETVPLEPRMDHK